RAPRPGPAQKPRRTPSRTATVVRGPGLRAPVRLRRRGLPKMAARAAADMGATSVAPAAAAVKPVAGRAHGAGSRGSTILSLGRAGQPTAAGGSGDERG